MTDDGFLKTARKGILCFPGQITLVKHCAYHVPAVKRSHCLQKAVTSSTLLNLTAVTMLEGKRWLSDDVFAVFQLDQPEALTPALPGIAGLWSRVSRPRAKQDVRCCPERQTRNDPGELMGGRACARLSLRVLSGVHLKVGLFSPCGWLFHRDYFYHRDMLWAHWQVLG